jgi:hypothetical protein
MLKEEVSLCGLRIAVQHHIGLQMCYATLLWNSVWRGTEIQKSHTASKRNI